MKAPNDVSSAGRGWTSRRLEILQQRSGQGAQSGVVTVRLGSYCPGHMKQLDNIRYDQHRREL
jgi:hypothetical protein